MSNTIFCLGIVWVCSALGKNEMANAGLVIFGFLADMFGIWLRGKQ